MKRLLLLMVCTVIMGACVDNDYDLGEGIETDNIGIGDPESEFVMPLANIHVSNEDLSIDNDDITKFFDEAKAWIPASYKSIEVQRLGDREYIDQWVEDLCKGMDNDATEFNRVVEHIHKTRRDDFSNFVTPTNNLDDYKAAFQVSWSDKQKRGRIEEQISEVVASEVASINTTVDPVEYEIGNDELDKDVIDMLIDDQNDDALELFGTIQNKIESIECTLKAEFVDTSVGFDMSLPAVTSGAAENTVAIPNVKIPANDAYAIIEHGLLRVTVTPVIFYPRTAYHKGEQMLVRLKLRRKGGLQVNF